MVEPQAVGAVPNRWANRLEDSILPDTALAPAGLPEISPDDSISRAGKIRKPPVFRGEDMGDPACRRDYGHAGTAYRRTDERDARARHRRESRDDQLTARRAPRPRAPESPLTRMSGNGYHT